MTAELVWTTPALRTVCRRPRLPRGDVLIVVPDNDARQPLEEAAALLRAMGHRVHMLTAAEVTYSPC